MDADLETRIARLERKSALWQVAAVGAALVAIINACGDKAAPVKELELSSGNTKVRVDGDKLVISSSLSTTTIDAYGLVVTTGKQELKASAAELRMTGCGPASPGCKEAHVAVKDGILKMTGPGGDSTLKAGRLDLEHDNRTIKADVTDEKDVWLVASAGGRSNALFWVKQGVAAISADVLPESGEAPHKISIGTDAKSTALLLARNGKEKKLDIAP